MKFKDRCPHCGSEDLSWGYSHTTYSGVQDGRLKINDISTVFFIGCNFCSETIQTVSANKVLEFLNAPNRH